MSFVVTVTWRAKQGFEAQATDVLRELSAWSVQEEGCRDFKVFRSTTSPREFFLYEVYADERAFRQHLASDHYRLYGHDAAAGLFEDKIRRDYIDI
jgi:quinol monooxygenase YgiN